MAERVTMAAAVLVVGLLLFGIVWIDTTQGTARPRIEVSPRLSDAYEDAGTWYLPVVVTNVGDEAVDMLRVDVVRESEDGSAPEVSDLEYTFVAAGERVRGVVAFDEEPAADAVRVDVVSVTEP